MNTLIKSSPLIATDKMMTAVCCLDIKKELATIKAMLQEIADNQQRMPIIPHGQQQ